MPTRTIPAQTVETKYYCFNQNNSGGYFIKDDEAGVAESIIIEATSVESAREKFAQIGKGVSGFYKYCGCCGERWSPEYVDEEDGYEVPSIYGQPLTEYKPLFGIRDQAFVHHLDGTIEKFTFSQG